MSSSPSFILPSQSVIKPIAGHGYSYAIYNYYGRGPIAAAKRGRFRRALALGAKVKTKRAIDMGCADGMLLPSLARSYERVAAIDVDIKTVARSRRLMDALEITNVRVACNRGVPVERIRDRIGDGYGVMFLLETLEHVGSRPDMWGSKMQFLRECFTLMEADGRIVISVPKMVGMVMLFKNLLQRSLGLGYDPMTWKQLFKSSIFKDTNELEPLWDGHHVGFNHLKLDEHLRREFVVHQRLESSISVFYLISQ